jgi:hypothetical protein
MVKMRTLRDFLPCGAAAWDYKNMDASERKGEKQIFLLGGYENV